MQKVNPFGRSPEHIAPVEVIATSDIEPVGMELRPLDTVLAHVAWDEAERLTIMFLGDEAQGILPTSQFPPVGDSMETPSRGLIARACNLWAMQAEPRLYNSMEVVAMPFSYPKAFAEISIKAMEINNAHRKKEGNAPGEAGASSTSPASE